MLTKLLLNPDVQQQKAEALKQLDNLGLKQNHPDVLWIEEDKLGVKQAEAVKEHLSFKPFQAQGKAVVIVDAGKLTPDAQNSLLKILEEPPQTASLILTAKSQNNILPTILSRSELINLAQRTDGVDDLSKVEELFNSTLEKRFEIIEKEEEREELLHALTTYITRELPNNPKLVNFAKLIMEAQKYSAHQGNIRTILEYLMLSLEAADK